MINLTQPWQFHKLMEEGNDTNSLDPGLLSIKSLEIKNVKHFLCSQHSCRTRCDLLHEETVTNLEEQVELLQFVDAEGRLCDDCSDLKYNYIK